MHSSTPNAQLHSFSRFIRTLPAIMTAVQADDGPTKARAAQKRSPARSLWLLALAAAALASAVRADVLSGAHAGPPVPAPPLPLLPPVPPDLRRAVFYHAPFFSGSGMGAEALLLVLGLQRHTEYAGRVWIASHGDADDFNVFHGMPPADQAALLGMLRTGQAASLEDARRAIIVCHSEPGAWALPEPLYETALCPPVPVGKAAFVVARAMFESDRISQEHARRCNQTGEVWVPTDFHRRTFAASGVDPSKLKVVPEPVDVDAFDPAAHVPFPLPLGTRVFGPAWAERAQGAAGGDGGAAGGKEGGSKPFVFLSVFKWEPRKGWDVLLRAYLTAFTAEDDVLLLLHTKPFHSDADFPQQMEDWVRRELPEAAARLGSLPPVYVLGAHLPQQEYPRLFRTADAFVLPTRGEGWGLPVAEAMAMQLPAIVTNWSGPTAYLDEGVGYPLQFQLADVPPGTGAFSGHRWAEPSAQHLAQLMRHMAAHRQEAAERGRAARRRMAERYSPVAVAEVVARQLRRIEWDLAGQQLLGAEGEEAQEAEEGDWEVLVGGPEEEGADWGAYAGEL